MFVVRVVASLNTKYTLYRNKAASLISVMRKKTQTKLVYKAAIKLLQMGIKKKTGSPFSSVALYRVTFIVSEQLRVCPWLGGVQQFVPWVQVGSLALL